MKVRANKYLIRFNYAKSKGWQFRYPKNGDWSDCDTHFFSDKQYGGNRQALKAARAYRDHYMATRGLSHRLKKPRDFSAPTIKHANNTSGVIGVKYTKTEKESGIYYHWVAYGMQSNQTWSRSFSILQYGEKPAFRMACKERYRRHGDLRLTTHVRDLPTHPGVPYVKKIDPASQLQPNMRTTKRG